MAVVSSGNKEAPGAEKRAAAAAVAAVGDNGEFVVKVSLNAACVLRDRTRTEAERRAWTAGVLVSGGGTGWAEQAILTGLFLGCYGYPWY